MNLPTQSKHVTKEEIEASLLNDEDVLSPDSEVVSEERMAGDPEGQG